MWYDLTVHVLACLFLRLHYHMKIGNYKTFLCDEIFEHDDDEKLD